MDNTVFYQPSDAQPTRIPASELPSASRPGPSQLTTANEREDFSEAISAVDRRGQSEDEGEGND